MHIDSDHQEFLSIKLRGMIGGFAATQLLVTAARLRIADHLASGGQSVAVIADSLGVESNPLCRFLRMLVALDVLQQTKAEHFALTDMGRLLCADHPKSMRDRLLFIGEINYPVGQESIHAVTTGEQAFNHVFGMPLFEYLDGHPDLRAIFGRLMGENVERRTEGICKAYDFTAATLIVDVGGGNGALLSAILSVAPGVRGIVFDRPSVANSREDESVSCDSAPRIEFLGGDMFKAIAPAGADIYILSNIIHDWNDGQASLILHNCGAVMKKDSRLLIIEEILPDRVEEAPATIANDYSMLLLTGGRQRTRDEFSHLLQTAGLRQTAVIPIELSTASARYRENWAIIECRPSS